MMMMRNLLLLLASLPSSTWAYDFTCNLHCYNEGECRHGKGKFGSYAGLEEDEEMPWEKSASAQSPSAADIGMFCSCPVGYTGLQCEIKLVVCGREDEDQHTCFNGSECRKERAGNGQIYYSCECDAANSVLDSKMAGRYCEHIATTFCGHDKNNPEFASTNFCTNGGRCIEKFEQKDGKEVHKGWGCECVEGYDGSTCDIASASTLTLSDLAVVATSKNSVGLVVGVIVGVVLIGLGVFFYRDRVEKKKKKQQRTNGHFRASAEMT